MAADLAVQPWPRLARLSPPDATEAELQEAADRWESPADIFNAAADLWEDRLFALEIPVAPDPGSSVQVAESVSQGDISVKYAASALNDPGTLYAAQSSAIRARISGLRSQGFVRSVRLTGRGYGRTLEAGRRRCSAVEVIEP